MDSTKTKRALIWGFPILILSAFLIAIWFIRSTDKSYQSARQRLGWTTWEEFAGCRDLILDSSGNLWVGGDNITTSEDCPGGFHMYDGAVWSDIEYAEGRVDEFTIDPKGQVLAIIHSYKSPFISVYNEQGWKTYSPQDLGTSEKADLNFGTDSTGRILVSVRVPTNHDLDEILMFENNDWQLGSRHDFGLPDQWQSRMVNNMEGWIWWDRSSDNGPGLYKINGKSTNEILYADESVEKISGVTLDKRNHLWVVNKCGNIGEFDGSSWTTYPKETSGPDFNQEPSYCDGRRHSYDIYIDAHDRVWIWERHEIRILENGTWITLTSENTGIVDDGIYIDLIVDNEDRVWILTTSGLSMLPFRDIQTLPLELVERWKWAMNLGAYLKRFSVALTIDLPLIWIMAILNLNVWRSVRVTDMETYSLRKTKRLAQTSLFFGDLSFGVPCFLLLLYLLSQLLEDAFLIGDAIGEYYIYILFFVPLSSTMSLVTAAITTRKIKKEGGDSDKMIRKMVKRGVLLGLLGFILIFPIGLLLFVYLFGY